MDDGTAVVSSSQSSFFRLAVPSVSRHLISVFPIFLFRSVSPIPPSSSRPSPSSSPRVRHFCLCFAAIVDRKRMSAPWKMAAVALPGREHSPSPPLLLSLHLSRHLPLPLPLSQHSATNILHPSLVDETRFIRPSLVLSFYPFTIVLSDFGHRSALESFDATRYMCSWRSVNYAFYHSSARVRVYVCEGCPVAHVITVIVSRHFRATRAFPRMLKERETREAL